MEITVVPGRKDDFGYFRKVKRSGQDVGAWTPGRLGLTGTDHSHRGVSDDLMCSK